MENRKNILRLEYMPIKDALELFKQGVFVKGVFPSDPLKEDLDGIDQNLKEKFLAYYCPNLQTGLFEYDMSIEDYEPELENVQLYDDVYKIKEIFSDELGFNIETEEKSVINYDSRLIYKDREVYNTKKQAILSKTKEIAKTVGSIFTAPLTRYVVMKANKVPEVERALQGGLYHFTSEKVADMIIKSGYIKTSSKIKSYSMKNKTFFFGENPELQDVLYNCKDLQKHMSAIHVKYNEALQRDISNGKVQVRLDDGAICIVGQTKKEHGYEFEKVQMELVKDEKTNRFYYKNVTDKKLTQEEIQSSKQVDEKLNRYLKIPKAVRELVTYPEVARRAVSRFVNSLTNKQKMLSKPIEQPSNVQEKTNNISSGTMLENLNGQVYSQSDISRNYNQNIENVYEKKDKNDLEV